VYIRRTRFGRLEAFLGTAGTMRIWIKDLSSIAKPLVDLTRKNVDLIWQDEHDHAMESLKHAIISSPALIPIDYKSGRTVFMSSCPLTRPFEEPVGCLKHAKIVL
jgi:hypothetical protein